MAVLQQDSPTSNDAVTEIPSTVYISANEYITARDLKTGSEYWKYNYPGIIYPSTGMLIVNNAAYFVSDSGLCKLDLTSRTLQWTKPLDTNTLDSIRSPKKLLYDSGRIFVQVDHLPYKTRRSSASTTWLACFNEINGNTLWQTNFTLKTVSFTVGKSTNPTIFKGTLVVGLGNDMATINASTGTLLWRKEVDAYSTRLLNPCISNGMIFSASVNNADDFLFAMKITNGKQVWTSPIPYHFYGNYTTPALLNGKIILNGIYGITAFDIKSGANLWQYYDSSDINNAPDFKAVTTMDSTIYTTNPRGSKVYSIAARNGALKYATGYLGYYGSNATQPVAANGYVMSLIDDSQCKSIIGVTGIVSWADLQGSTLSINCFVIKDINNKTYYSRESGMTQ